MPTDAATIAAPSAATEQGNPFASGKLTKEISDAWTEGKDISVPQTEKPATPDPSKEMKSEDVESKSAPDPDAGKQKQEKGPHRKLSAEERINQLIAENKALKEAAKTRPTSETKTAEPSPAKPEPPKKLEAPVKPDIKDFDSIEKYEAAKDDYYDKLAEYRSKLAVEEDRQQRAREAQQQTFSQQLKEARERYPDFDAKAEPTRKTLFDDAAVPEVIKAALGTSPVSIDILYTLGIDSDTLSRFAGLAKTDAIQAIKYLGVLEDLVLRELDKSKTSDKGKEKQPPAKTATSEPPPLKETPTVGTRGTGPSDPAAEAVRRSNGKLTKDVEAAWMRKRAARFNQ